MLELTAGHRCVSGEEAVEFFEALAGVAPAESAGLALVMIPTNIATSAGRQ